MKKTSPAYVLLFMTAICIVFGTAIAFVHYSTLPLLARNETLHRNRILAEAFLLPAAGRDAAVYEKVIKESLTLLESPENQRSRSVWRGPDETTGFEFSGMGFWDRISGVIVLERDLSTIVNVQFFDHKETPGLGARIEEPSFTGQFRGKIIDWDAAADRRFVIGTLAGVSESSRIDAVTGATQTSSSLMRFLNNELEAMRAYMDKLRQHSPEVEG